MIELLILGGLTIAEQSQPAVRAVLEAGYKQSGLEARIDEKTGQLEKHYVDPNLRYYLTPTLAIGRAIAEQRITLTFHF